MHPVSTVENKFIRNRNVLLSQIDCSLLFESFETHATQFDMGTPEPIKPLFLDLLAAFALYCASRPRRDLLAWTIRFTQPHVSFFYGGDNELGSVVGRYFDQNIKADERGEMHMELHRPGKDPHRSMVEFDGDTAEAAIHEFFDKSEQRPARFFKTGQAHYSLASAHPDYDEGWFTHLSAEQITGIASTETLNLLETRASRWWCGCSQEKIVEMLKSIVKKDPQSVFGDEATAVVNCPRCSANYTVARSNFAGV
jgi:molecular chaperone Hsp33